MAILTLAGAFWGRRWAAFDGFRARTEAMLVWFGTAD
eukprot:SAG31_NODE_30713_length_377_cov_0.708633_1_plen_36_part_10